MRSLKRELQIVNRAREVLGLVPLTEFPRARPRFPFHCLIALSFNTNVGATEHGQYVCIYDRKKAAALRSLWRTRRETSHRIYLPPLLNKLAHEFDNRKLSDLIEGETLEL